MKWGSPLSRTRLAGLATLALLPLSACGGDGSPEETVERFLGALRDADANGACEQLGSRTLADLERSGSCEVVFEQGLELLDEKQVEIPDYEVGEVEIEGERAELTLRSGAEEQALGLLREGGEWKLDGATALSQFHPSLPATPAAGTGG